MRLSNEMLAIIFHLTSRYILFYLSEAANEERKRQMKNLEELQKELAQMKKKLNDASSMYRNN